MLGISSTRDDFRKWGLMTDTTSVRLGKIVLAVALVVSLSAVITGCGKKAADTTPTAPKGKTAMDSLKAAQSTLSTTAPDAKLLVVQTGAVVTSTSAPVWQYLFGSPKTDTVYAVTVMSGAATATPYGTAGLSKTEWAAVPSVDKWKIDSDEALKKAMATYPNAKASTAYLMGFVTYTPKGAASATKPMIWDITFDPASLGKETTSTVNVDVATGAAKLAGK